MRLIALVLLAAACGNISRQNPHDAGAPPEGGAPPPPPDAAVLREAREFVTGGARMSGATYTLDVQIGHAIQQSKTSGASFQFNPNAAVKP